jgi:hypothetical protein
MPKITWLGDDPCIWNEVTFLPGVPMDIDDPYMIGKARHSPFFRLEEDVAPAPVQSVFGPMPEMWTETAPEDAMAFEAMETDHPPKRKRGRPPKVRHNGE